MRNVGTYSLQRDGPPSTPSFPSRPPDHFLGQLQIFPKKAAIRIPWITVATHQPGGVFKETLRVHPKKGDQRPKADQDRDLRVDHGDCQQVTSWEFPPRKNRLKRHL